MRHVQHPLPRGRVRGERAARVPEVVQELASQVLERESFAPYRGWINVYRMDLVSRTMWMSTCSDRCTSRRRSPPRPPLAAAETDGSVALGHRCSTQGGLGAHAGRSTWWRGAAGTPEARRSPGTATSSGSTPTDRARRAGTAILRAQHQGRGRRREPAATSWEGGWKTPSRRGRPDGDRILARPGEDGYSLAGPWAAALLEHEFGHLFGLYDEYVAVTGRPRGVVPRRPERLETDANAQTRRSDVSPPIATSDYETCKDLGLDTATIKLAPPIPWQATLDMCCPKAGIDELHRDGRTLGR